MVTVSAATLTSSADVESADTVTAGGLVNLPCGNVTVFVLNPPDVTVTVSPLPAAIFGIPVMDPSALNVSGPQCPDPSPLTSKAPLPDLSTAGVEAGNEFEEGGVNVAIPGGTVETVTSAGTVDLAQRPPPPDERAYKRFCNPARTGREIVIHSRAATLIVATGDEVVSCVPSYHV